MESLMSSNSYNDTKSIVPNTHNFSRNDRPTIRAA
jgi:hypothetical protein